MAQEQKELDMVDRDPNGINSHVKKTEIQMQRLQMESVYYSGRLHVNDQQHLTAAISIGVFPLSQHFEKIQVAFEDVLAEPDGAHSIDCVWLCSYSCFNCGKNCCYKLMTTLCGMCLALAWGCEFALITFQQVWCVTPSLRIFGICMGCMQKFFGTFMSCCLAPICETVGLCFSNITVKNA